MRVRTNGADEAFHEIGEGPWRLSRSRFSIVNDTHKWTLKFYDGNPYAAHDHAQIQENAERLCWTLNHIAHLEGRVTALEEALTQIQKILRSTPACRGYEAMNDNCLGIAKAALAGKE
jgi:hypothetical protein